MPGSGKTTQSIAVSKSLPGTTGTVAKCSQAKEPSEVVSEHVQEHIFKGGIDKKGKSNGCHSKIAIEEGHAKFVGTKKIGKVPPGLYTCGVAVKNEAGEFIVKKRASTFFPDDWDKDKVVSEIAAAFSSKDIVWDKDAPQKWSATSPSGVKISGFVDKDDPPNITSAFPDDI